MDNYVTQVKFKYRILSKIYDSMDVLFFPFKRSNPRKGLAELIPNSDLSILDVCVGTGNSTLAVAGKNNHNKITGIDLSEDMLKVAATKIKRQGITNVSLYSMNAADIRIDEKFDIVTTSLSLHEMPDTLMHRVISEMSRVLKDKGTLCIMEWQKPKSFFGSLAFMVFPYLLEPKGFGSFLKLDWHQYLKQFGLTVEREEHYTFTKLIIAKKQE